MLYSSLVIYMNTKKAFIVVDLGFGDFGKGTTVDFLTRKYKSDLNVRFSGGAQCAHHVVDENGNHHMFSQFGAGTLAGARTLLGKNVLVNPITLIEEETRLFKLVKNPLEKLYIDENAVIITPYHRLVNQLLEKQRGNSKHGSCGHGIWQTRLDSINNARTCLRAGDLYNYDLLEDKLLRISNRMHDILVHAKVDANISQEIFSNINGEKLIELYRSFYSKVHIVDFDNVQYLINNSNAPILEGNQGVLLDEDEGFYPYTTGTSTTSKHALQMLIDCNWKGEKEVIGGLRTFMTRHGVGPLPTEDKELNSVLTDKYNLTNEWQDNFRFGWLDLNFLRYAIQVDKNIDSLALTHIDELSKFKKWKVCHHYEENGLKWALKKEVNPTIEKMETLTKRILNSKPIYEEYEADEIIPMLEWELERKVRVKSFGPKSNEKEFVLI